MCVTKSAAVETHSLLRVWHSYDCDHLTGPIARISSSVGMDAAAVYGTPSNVFFSERCSWTYFTPEDGFQENKEAGMWWEPAIQARKSPAQGQPKNRPQCVPQSAQSWLDPQGTKRTPKLPQYPRSCYGSEGYCHSKSAFIFFSEPGLVFGKLKSYFGKNTSSHVFRSVVTAYKTLIPVITFC